VDVLDRSEMARMRPTQRLIALCRALSGKRYLSGPSARAYLDEHEFGEAGIEVVWASYEGYREYPQLWGAFEPRVSVMDLLLNMGAGASALLAARDHVPVTTVSSDS
jgi:hypothetical protein